LKETWDNLQFGLRIGKRPRQCITTTPRPIKLLKQLVARDGQDVRVTRGTTFDNRANLAESFFSQIVSQYSGTRLGRQELNAEILEDTPGALWTRDLLEQCRKSLDALPTMKRIVVALDPATTVSDTANESGIVVAGLGNDDHGYVLEDASGRFSPIDWARRAVALYHRYGADRIVAEQNQGGALVETTIRTVDQNVSFKSVHASRGKITRAEPIAALFEQRRIHLVGSFQELEDQLTSFAPGQAGSPDRLDAMVWAFTELMVQTSGCDGFLHYYKSLHDAGGDFVARGWIEEQPAATIKLIAPGGVGAVQLLSGRNVNVPWDGSAIEMSEEDARPLLRAGWIPRAGLNSPD
jgi:predicted phage terminase large subunit-like protein